MGRAGLLARLAGSPAGVYYYVWRYSTDCDATERPVRGTITLAR